MPTEAARQGVANNSPFLLAAPLWKTPLLVLIAFLPVVTAYAILYRQSLAVPYWDDYHAILSFSLGYEQLPTFKEKLLKIAAEQHNEYKLTFEHSIVAAELEATHRLDFGFLAALGDLFLLPIAYLLWHVYLQPDSSPGRRLLEFLPVVFLLFSLTYWETLNWAMAGLQNIPILLFSLASIYFLAPREAVQPSATRIAISCFAAAIAALTSANGFLLGPVGLLMLLPRRAYRLMFIWCASFVLPLVAYLYRYHFFSVVHPDNHSYYLTRLLFLLGFLGGVVPYPWVAALLGLAVLTTVFLSYRTGFHRQNPAAFYFTVWVLLTAGLVAWVRGTVGFTISSRYSMYSILLLIFCYQFFLYALSRRPSLRLRFCLLSLAAASLFCLAADLHAYNKLGERRRMVLSGIELYRRQPDINSPMIDPKLAMAAPYEKAYEIKELTDAIRQGVYTLPLEITAR